MQADAGSEELRSWIVRAAERAPGKPWIVSADDGRTVTYGQLRDIVGRFATFLRARGLGPNDRVALLANNSIEHLLCYFGVMAHGATICTIHVEMNRNQLDNIFERLKPKLVLYQEGLNLDDLLAGIPPPRLRLGRWDAPAPDTLFAALARCTPSDAPILARPDDDAVILFTSGTSARPKGVVLNFREHLSNIDPTAEGFGITANDRVYDFRSFNWASAQLLGALDKNQTHAAADCRQPHPAVRIRGRRIGAVARVARRLAPLDAAPDRMGFCRTALSRPRDHCDPALRQQARAATRRSRR